MHDEQYDAQLHDYLNNHLTDEDRLLFEDHVASCEFCQAELLIWQRIAGAVIDAAEVRAVSLPPLKKSVRRKPMLRALPSQHSSFQLLLAAAAIAVLLWGIILTQVPLEPMLLESIQPTQQDHVRVPMVLAARNITPGQMIQAEDVVLFEMPIAFLPNAHILDIQDVIGQVATTPIMCGQPVLTDQVRVIDEEMVIFPRDPQFDALVVCETISFEPLPERFATVDLPFSVSMIEALDILTAEPEQLHPQLLPYPEQLVPDNFMLPDIDGKLVIFSTPPEALISPFMLLESWAGTDYRWVEVPRHQILNDVTPFQFGDVLEVGGVLYYVDVSETMQQPVYGVSTKSQIVFQSVASEVLYWSVPYEGSGTVILGVANQSDASTLSFLINADLPLLLTHSISMEAMSNENMQVYLPEGMVSVWVRASAWDVRGLEVGDQAEIILSNGNLQQGYDAVILSMSSASDRVLLGVDQVIAPEILTAINQEDVSIVFMLR